MDFAQHISIYPKPLEIKKIKVKFPFYFTEGMFLLYLLNLSTEGKAYFQNLKSINLI
jgi:hypothetical protein